MPVKIVDVFLLCQRHFFAPKEEMTWSWRTAKKQIESGNISAVWNIKMMCATKRINIHFSFSIFFLHPSHYTPPAMKSLSRNLACREHLNDNFHEFSAAFILHEVFHPMFFSWLTIKDVNYKNWHSIHTVHVSNIHTCVHTQYTRLASFVDHIKMWIIQMNMNAAVFSLRLSWIFDLLLYKFNSFCVMAIKSIFHWFSVCCSEEEKVGLTCLVWATHTY